MSSQIMDCACTCTHTHTKCMLRSSCRMAWHVSCDASTVPATSSVVHLLSSQTKALVSSLQATTGILAFPSHHWPVLEHRIIYECQTKPWRLTKIMCHSRGEKVHKLFDSAMYNCPLQIMSYECLLWADNRNSVLHGERAEFFLQIYATKPCLLNW
jgi:hypothetical protein